MIDYFCQSLKIDSDMMNMIVFLEKSFYFDDPLSIVAHLTSMFHIGTSVGLVELTKSEKKRCWGVKQQSKVAKNREVM